jgi:hypothetical protein
LKGVRRAGEREERFFDDSKKVILRNLSVPTIASG